MVVESRARRRSRAISRRPVFTQRRCDRVRERPLRIAPTRSLPSQALCCNGSISSQARSAIAAASNDGILSLSSDGLAPRRHARIFVPVEIIDHRIATFRRTRGQIGQKALCALADRLEPGKVARRADHRPRFRTTLAPPHRTHRPLLPRARCAPCPSGSDTAARPINAFKPEGDKAHCGASRRMRRRALKTAWARVSSRVGDRISIFASCKTRSSIWTSSPSIHALAQASIKCVRAIQPSRMGLTRSRSSNRDNASSAAPSGPTIEGHGKGNGNFVIH